MFGGHYPEAVVNSNNRPAAGWKDKWRGVLDALAAQPRFADPCDEALYADATAWFDRQRAAHGFA